MSSPVTKRAHLLLDTPDTSEEEPVADEVPSNVVVNEVDVADVAREEVVTTDGEDNDPQQDAEGGQGALELEDDEDYDTDEFFSSSDEEVGAAGGEVAIEGEGEEAAEGDNENNEPVPKEIQFDFEARTPRDKDFHGIKTLVKSHFRFDNYTVSTNTLTQYIINQDKVGSVVKQVPALDEDGNCPDYSEDEYPYDCIFGLLTVVRIKEPIQGHELKGYLQTIVKEKGDFNPMSHMIDSPGKDVGLIVSERLRGMPSTLSKPLYRTLFGEIDRAIRRGLPFNFTHYIMMIRIRDPSISDENADSTIRKFYQCEEEIFMQLSDQVYDTKDAKMSKTLGDPMYGMVVKILVFSKEKISHISKRLKAL